MAHRSLWSGSISLGLITVPVEAVKATEGYEGDESFRQLSECHHAPMKRVEQCSVCGKRRLTQAMLKAGDVENATPLVKGVQTGEDAEGNGEYVVLEQGAIDEINESVSSHKMELIAAVPYDEAPLAWATGTYYLRPSKKVDGADEPFVYLVRTLEGLDKVLICKWSPRGRQNLVAISADSGLLVMQGVHYVQETRPPDELFETARNMKVDQAGVEMMGQLLDKLVPSELDMDSLRDEAVDLKLAAIEAAVEGKPIQRKDEEPEAKPATDLMAALAASVEAVGGAQPKAAPKRKAPAKAKAKAKGAK